MIFLSIKECFTKVKQVFLLYLWESLVTLELISLIPLAGSPETDPPAVKLLENRLYIFRSCAFSKKLEISNILPKFEIFIK